MADAKIWFVHDGTAKSGPFSEPELQSRFDRGEVLLGHYLWKEGMPGWKKASDLDVLRPAPAAMPPSFGPGLEPAPRGEAATRVIEYAPSEAVALAPSGYGEAAQPRPQTRTISPATASAASMPADYSRTGDDLSALIEVPAREAVESTGLLDVGQLRNARREAANAVKVAQSQQRIMPTPQFGRGLRELGFMPRLLICLGLVGAAGGAFWCFLPDIYTTSVTGSIQKAFSPIPGIKDVSTTEYAALSAVAQAGLEQGMRAEFALSQLTPETPAFYVATNQPAGTQLVLVLDPVLGTLVADAPGSIQVTLSVTDKLGKTAQIKTKEGGNLPMGEYKVDLKDKDNRVLSTHQYFLGGAQDGAYQARLNEYLNGRRSRGQAEIQLYKAVADKIDALATLERQTAPGIVRGNPASRDKAWSDYEAQWSAKLAEIDHDLLDPARVFTKLQRSTQDARASLAQVHKAFKAQVDGAGAQRAPSSAGAPSDMAQLSAVLTRDIADARERAEAALKAVAATGFIKED